LKLGACGGASEKMNRSISSMAFAAITAGSTWSAEATAAQLLSIATVELGPKEYIAAFQIDTWGIYPLAVCHIPAGWSLTAGTDGSPIGALSGSAGVGLAFLSGKQIPQLRDLFLIVDPVPVENPPPTVPPTFDGKVYVGTYGSDSTPSLRALKPTNIELTPAQRCPDPPSN
jgi:hypothetical protein